jgi:hypothetical protein
MALVDPQRNSPICFAIPATAGFPMIFMCRKSSVPHNTIGQLSIRSLCAKTFEARSSEFLALSQDMAIETEAQSTSRTLSEML